MNRLDMCVYLLCITAIWTVLHMGGVYTRGVVCINIDYFLHRRHKYHRQLSKGLTMHTPTS